MRLSGGSWSRGAENVIHGSVKVAELKGPAAATGEHHKIPGRLPDLVHLRGVPGRTAVKAPHRGESSHQPAGLLRLPDHINFFAVTAINYQPAEVHEPFEQILKKVSEQMDEQIVKEKLEETISYNVSNEKKWYVRIIPLCVKWLALGMIFRRNDRAHTITLSISGPYPSIRNTGMRSRISI